MKQRFDITGMSCAACSARVERAVSGLAGVDACSVNLLTATMDIEGDISDREVIDAVKKSGYGASVHNDKNTESSKNENNSLQKLNKRRLVLRLTVSALILLPLMYISMGANMLSLPMPEFVDERPLLSALLQLILSLAVILINSRFFISGIGALLKLSPNMDTLVSVGSGASFIWSVILTVLIGVRSVSGDHTAAHELLHELYFESAAMILVLITVGKMLESRAKERTTDAISALLDLSPRTARILENGEEREILAADIKPGDIFIVKAGESIPADGVVLFGSAAVSESALTGESVPADKSEGDRVLCATLNTNGYLRCRATKVGDDTAIADVIRLVSDASATKAPIAKLADKVSGIFVPAVILIALLTFSIWLIIGKDVGYALERGISVLVISCPCALGLATPVAIMVGNGVGARHGVLFKSAEALEHCAGVRTVIFDKTGTITSGTPSVTDIIPNGIESLELLEIAAGIEAASEHPLGAAVVRKAADEGITYGQIENFEVFAGSGVRGRLSGKDAVGGKLSFIEEISDIEDEVRSTYKRLSGEGKTPLLFAVDGKYIGMIAVSDTLKEDSARAVKALRSAKIKAVLLTGDNEITARAIGESVGFDEIIAGVLPDGKEREVAKRLGNGPVMMVGDGINDAPAIMRADIGVAIGAGADIAIDAADIVISGSRVFDVVRAISISKRTLLNIKENLFWAFFYNALGIPLAAGAFASFGWELSPMFGAFAMSISSLFVVLNALRLKFFDGGDKSEKQHKERDKSVKMVENNHYGTEDNEKMGDFEMIERVFCIEGMMCPHCEARVKSAVDSTDGVIESFVSHKVGEARVTIDTLRTDTETVRSAIEAAGYKVTSVK